MMRPTLTGRRGPTSTASTEPGAPRGGSRATTKHGGPLPGRSPSTRKLVVAAHIVVSVGLLGLSTALFVLATVAALTSDFATTQAAYRSMGIFIRGVVQPVAVLTIVTGVVLSLGTQWGLFQHHWIVVKLVLTIATILNGMLNLGPAVDRVIAMTANASAAAPPDLGTTALAAMAVPGVNVLMLGAATAISVYKPWGTIRRRPAG